VPAFDVIENLEEIHVVAHRARYRAQTADMLGMIPSRVMPAAVSV
jgi:hypothetical protein